MAYLSEEKKVEQALEKEKEQAIQRRNAYSREVFLIFVQKELGITLTTEQKAKFLAYIKHRFDVCQCCVLYTRLERVRDMFTDLGLSKSVLGMREFIIFPDFSCRFSPNYKKAACKPVKATFNSWGAY